MVNLYLVLDEDLQGNYLMEPHLKAENEILENQRLLSNFLLLLPKEISSMILHHLLQEAVAKIYPVRSNFMLRMIEMSLRMEI